jgi:homogentisate 1,2-dioxygenase
MSDASSSSSSSPSAAAAPAAAVAATTTTTAAAAAATAAVTAAPKYLSGFGGHAESEALPGALPRGQNSPQVCPYGLYAEQLSGTAFTLPRHSNQRSWLYRIHPSVLHSRFERVDSGLLVSSFEGAVVDPNQLRWMPPPLPSPADRRVDFVQGLMTMMGAGDVASKSGIAIHLYACNADMGRRAFYNSD